MINGELIGAAILTYNRPETCYGLIQKINSCKDVDFLVVVKDKDVDYGRFSPSNIDQDNYEFIQVEGLHNIAYCKNLGIKSLLRKRCQHIFVIEDDMIIKDTIVFSKYIETAKAFKLGHLNWNTLPDVSDNPVYEVVGPTCSLDIALRICGCFSYFSNDALQQCGLLDEVNYNNAFEHADHAYRMAAQKFTTPFFAFADIHNASIYLENVGEGKTTLDHDSAQYKNDVYASSLAFMRIYGRPVNKIPIPTSEQVCRFLKERVAL